MKTKLIMKNYFVELLNIAMIFIFWSTILTGGILYISNNSFSLSLEEYRLFLWLITGSILSIIYIIYRKKSYFRNEIWDLNNHILTKGHPINTTFDLNTIEHIVHGIPKPKWILYLEKISFFSNKNILYASSITIKFKDNTYLIFNISEIDNGYELINRIFSDYQDKIIEDYIFTEEERKLLKIGMSNRLLKIT